MLNAQQQAIQSLQADLARASVSTNTSPLPRIPQSAAPEKCEAEMSSASFRSWRRSMSCWLQLCRWPPSEAVHHIRLHCVPTLQRSLDARFTEAQWSALTPEEALDAVGKLVLRSSNQAAQWSEFFNVVQTRDQSINDYFAKCAQVASDCDFKCPNCDFNLSEYMLMRKLMIGLSDQELKRQVFQSCNQFDNVDALRAMCCAFEAARRDAFGGKLQPDDYRAAGIDTADNGMPEAAAASRSKPASSPSTQMRQLWWLPPSRQGIMPWQVCHLTWMPKGGPYVEVLQEQEKEA